MTNSTFDNITIFNKLFKKNDYITKNYNKKKIKMWAGNIPPNGFVWCDGNNGTPDLRNKFIYFVDNTSNTLTNIGNNDITNIPSHSHSVSNVITNTSINNTSNSLRLNKMEYKNYNRTGERVGGNDFKRTENIHQNHVNKNHTHGIANNNAETSSQIKDHIQINNFSPQETLKLETDETFETMNIPGQTGSTQKFEPKYIYIGFIMKL